MVLASEEKDEARRRYWKKQMIAGDQLVQKLKEFPVKECFENFVALEDLDPKVEIIYSKSNIAGSIKRVFAMRESIAHDVIRIGKEMNERGWVLKIEDCYRSLEMQRELVRNSGLFDGILKKCVWENGGKIPTTEEVFKRVTVLVANIPKIGTHMSGSAIDISVYNRKDGCEIWRGNPYLEMSEMTPMASPYVEQTYLDNRFEITAILEKHGFIHYPFEFWHYNKGDALAHLLQNNHEPARFGPVHWDSKTNCVTVVENSLEPLIPLSVLEKEISVAIERSKEN